MMEVDVSIIKSREDNYKMNNEENKEEIDDKTND